MATRSHIGVKQPNGTIDYIYCHWDGYPGNNGAILINYYQDITKANQLLELGDLSFLEEDTDSCVAYGRDKGDANTGKRNGSLKGLLNETFVDYLYVFEEGKWICYETGTDKAIDLEQYKGEIV